MVPVSSRFWVRSAGHELLVTPTREAVTWGSLLYTFRWLLDRGSCVGKHREAGVAGERSPLLRELLTGSMVLSTEQARSVEP